MALSPKKIEELREQARESHFQQQDFEREMNTPTELHWLLQQLPAWRRWYLKRNQQQNYIRVTRIIPPGMEERPFFWLCNIQIWIKNELQENIKITTEAFEHFYESPEWEKIMEPGIAKAILRPAHTP